MIVGDEVKDQVSQKLTFLSDSNNFESHCGDPPPQSPDLPDNFSHKDLKFQSSNFLGEIVLENHLQNCKKIFYEIPEK